MAARVRPGDVIGDKFRVERVLGEGGMGVVVAAHHLQLDERVALKFLLPEAVESAESTARFAREARVIAKLKSEHVARVSDVGTLPDGSSYIVMEYLDGHDVEREIELRGSLPVEEAVDLLLQALEAIAEAHSLGIVHRDLKPANLFLTARRDGSRCVKVLDFGISKLQSGGGNVTQSDAPLGTPLYMAPEQWASARNADARSDLWSLGAILHHMISGQPPFDGETIPAIWHAIANQEPPTLSSLRPSVPPALEDAVLRCLSRNPGDRLGSVGDLAGLLAPFSSALGHASAERVLAVLDRSGMAFDDAARDSLASARSAAEPTLIGATLSAGTPRHRTRRALVAAGIVLVLGLVGVVLTTARGTRALPVASVASSGPVAGAPSASATTAAPVVEPLSADVQPQASARTQAPATPAAAPTRTGLAAPRNAPSQQSPPPATAAARHARPGNADSFE